MTKWKTLAIVFSLITLGILNETFRIFTSSDADIAENRTELIVMAIIGFGVFIFLTIKFWRKASSSNRL